MSGIRKTRLRKDGTVKSYYRYPVTDIVKGEVCPLCFRINVKPECHHIVSVSETLNTIGYIQHWHNNIINICAECHAKITHGVSGDSVLIVRRSEYFMSFIHGLCTYQNRSLLKHACDEAQICKELTKGDNAFLDTVFMFDSGLRLIAKAHYIASFSETYIQRASSEKEKYFFLSPNECKEILLAIPTHLSLDAASATRLQDLFSVEVIHPAMCNGSPRRAQSGQEIILWQRST